MIGNRFAWEEKFPPVYIHTSISFLKRCKGFYAAKNGNMAEAQNVVDICIKSNRISEIKQKYKDAILLPVMNSNNKLPEALAEKIGLKTHSLVYQISKGYRKNMSGLERLIHQPRFTGVIKKNKNYILVDDVISQGGTISALRKYVLKHGGRVCAVIALSHSLNSRTLAPDNKTIKMLSQKFTNFDFILKNYFNMDNLRELTNPQIRYLLRFKETNKIINKINKVLCTPREHLH